MLIKSTYLKKEIEIDSVDFVDGQEDVKIIPHATLEDIVYNDPICVENVVQPHFLCVVSEPHHYAFLCTLTDRNGRRVEGIGESLPETLSTDIARKYPVLMAQKRAFDDAAMKFLGIANAYSDAQIQKDKAYENGKTPSPKQEDTPANSSAIIPEKAPSSKQSAIILEDTAPVEEPVHMTVDKDEEVVLKPSAPVPSAPVPSAPVPSAPVPSEPSNATAMPEISAPSAAPTATVTPAVPEYDPGSEILLCGKLKRMKVSIREAFKIDPSAVSWVAFVMGENNPMQKKQKKCCADFLASVGYTEEDYRNGKEANPS